MKKILLAAALVTALGAGCAGTTNSETVSGTPAVNTPSSASGTLTPPADSGLSPLNLGDYSNTERMIAFNSVKTAWGILDTGVKLNDCRHLIGAFDTSVGASVSDCQAIMDWMSAHGLPDAIDWTSVLADDGLTRAQVYLKNGAFLGETVRGDYGWFITTAFWK